MATRTSQSLERRDIPRDSVDYPTYLYARKQKKNVTLTRPIRRTVIMHGTTPSEAYVEIKMTVMDRTVECIFKLLAVC